MIHIPKYSSGHASFSNTSISAPPWPSHSAKPRGAQLSLLLPLLLSSRWRRRRRLSLRALNEPSFRPTIRGSVSFSMVLKVRKVLPFGAPVASSASIKRPPCLFMHSAMRPHHRTFLVVPSLTSFASRIPHSMDGNSDVFHELFGNTPFTRLTTGLEPEMDDLLSNSRSGRPPM
jgi:hypothetical protein